MTFPEHLTPIMKPVLVQMPLFGEMLWDVRWIACTRGMPLPLVIYLQIVMLLEYVGFMLISITWTVPLSVARRRLALWLRGLVNDLKILTRPMRRWLRLRAF